MHWDLFCRVVDNHGDIGVCWRLAADLGSRGEQVSLWVDDDSALSWMAPAGATGVTVRPWDSVSHASVPGDVVIEAFGCNPPEAFLRRMVQAPVTPVWINLEYLSAEDYVERSHGLPSPQQSGPARGLLKWFYYPGFTPATGGLLRETDLMARRRAFDAEAWLDARGRREGERTASLFCYPNPALPALLEVLARVPTLLFVTPGHAARQVQTQLGNSSARSGLRALMLPRMTQHDFDHLLWACDLNFVRGEDSFVRAQWAGRPFVWQVYPQDDGAHVDKLNAFLDRHLRSAAPALATPLRRLWAAWNGLAEFEPGLPGI
ncbi:MAG: elongation factor P maturation arginine rhamnosyltransferase EarP, partial [Rhizobacter sp.]|nr:elongation factor P maturation arginine rhamnosyltransferase EarP [Rhizobacter sp.]